MYIYQLIASAGGAHLAVKINPSNYFSIWVEVVVGGGGVQGWEANAHSHNLCTNKRPEVASIIKYLPQVQEAARKIKVTMNCQIITGTICISGISHPYINCPIQIFNNLPIH